MSLLVRVIGWEVWVFLLALAAIVVVQMLNGHINTKSMLCGSDGSMMKNGGISPARVQLLLSTLGLALYYLVQVMTKPTAGALPEVPDSWPAMLGGSHAIYLGRKAYVRFLGMDGGKAKAKKHTQHGQ